MKIDKIKFPPSRSLRGASSHVLPKWKVMCEDFSLECFWKLGKGFRNLSLTNLCFIIGCEIYNIADED